MKKQVMTAFAALVLVGCGSADLLNLRGGKSDSKEFSLGQASAKSTAAVGNIAVIDSTELDWQTVLSNSIKTSASSSLFISGSIECGLFTQTKVASKGGKKESSTASATVQMRVLVDGKLADPGEITFCSRAQTLTATFQGLLTDADGNSCLTTDLVTGATIIDEECLRPEEVELILSTMNANAFNFVGLAGQGTHKVEFQAKISSSTSTTSGGTASAMATIGKGAVLMESVRLRKGDPILQ
ncbi:MAG: hypothetical protein AB7T49_10340 [Oligoflexales bacterium]